MTGASGPVATAPAGRGGAWALAALAGLVAVTLWLRSGEADAAAAIQAELLDPYAAALAAGDVAAMRALSTARRRDEVGEIVLIAAVARLRDELGDVQGLRWDGQPAEQVTAPGGRRVTRIAVDLFGPRGSVPLWVDAEAVADGWRLDETWTRPAGGVGAPRVL